MPVTSRKLILLLTNLLAITLTRQRFFYTLLLTWFQIKRVTLDFLDDVFGLHLALKATERILKGFTFLYSNLCQEKYTSQRPSKGYVLEYPVEEPMGHKSSKKYPKRSVPPTIGQIFLRAYTSARQLTIPS
jgi:hypothetical protein